MGQTFHKFRAETFDEAYQQMVRALGEGAIVISTTEVTEGGVLGFLGRKLVELTVASTPKQAIASSARRPSLPERKYAACAAAVGSDQTVNETVAYFKQLVSDAQARMARSRATAPATSPARTATSVLPFRRRPESSPQVEHLEREVHQMRKMLQVLVAEAPNAGFPPEFAPHYRNLVEQGVTRGIAASLVAGVLKGRDRTVLRNPRVFTERLRMEIIRRLAATHGVKLVRGVPRVVALVGATGVGKTTNLAKLAAHYAIRERAHVALVTLDTYRVAAPEQLRVYANILGLPMQVATCAVELTEALQAFRGYDLVFMDTAGGSQFNQEQIGELQALFDVARPDEVLLLLTANTQVEESRTILTNFRVLQPMSLLFTKLDETRRYGALFSIAAEARLPLSYFSTGQNVPDDIELATPRKTAKLLLENEGVCSGSSARSS